MDGLLCIADRRCLSEFNFPFDKLGSEKPGDMHHVGKGLPVIKSKADPMSLPETQELLEGHAADPYSLVAFEQDIENLMAGDPNPKTFSEQQMLLMRQVPFKPRIRIVGSA